MKAEQTDECGWCDFPAESHPRYATGRGDHDFEPARGRPYSPEAHAAELAQADEGRRAWCDCTPGMVCHVCAPGSNWVRPGTYADEPPTRKGTT